MLGGLLVLVRLYGERQGERVRIVPIVCFPLENSCNNCNNYSTLRELLAPRKKSLVEAFD
jgi:hypothetical protein